jgi:hypothetical protein
VDSAEADRDSLEERMSARRLIVVFGFVVVRISIRRLRIPVKLNHPN